MELAEITEITQITEKRGLWGERMKGRGARKL